MSNLYIITGPAGVGKSTISKKIAELKEKSVLIEGDEIYHQVVGGYIQAWKEGNHLETFWKVCINTIKIYLEDGYDVIFNYIISPKDIEKIKEELKKYSIKFVVLLVDEKTLLARDKERPRDCQMKERCIILLNNFKNKNYNENNIIDTSNLTINEVIEIIENEDRFII
ncbi:MAG: AAA family ATPase [Clostridia bacterium]|nr:AAA family ATPase [Clostridia bacterium]